MSLNETYYWPQELKRPPIAIQCPSDPTAKRGDFLECHPGMLGGRALGEGSLTFEEREALEEFLEEM